MGPIQSMVLSADGQRLATTSKDKMLKIFDVTSFDMINMIAVDFLPGATCWLSQLDEVAVSCATSGSIFVYRCDDQRSSPIREFHIHKSAVVCMIACPFSSVIVSCDQRGLIEYWDSTTGIFPEQRVSFELKSNTDLYDLLQSKTVAYSMTFSPRGEIFVVLSRDKIVRLFDFKTGRICKKFDESSSSYIPSEISLKTSSSMENSNMNWIQDNIHTDIELGRKIAIESDLEDTVDALNTSNAIFDETGYFLIYPTLVGVKMVNLETNQIVRILGSTESGERFLSLALYQGIPKVDKQYLLSKVDKQMDANVSRRNESEGVEYDPTIYCSSFRRRRFYCFSRRSPDEGISSRDIFNEKPLEGESLVEAQADLKNIPSEVVLITTFGDINIRLFTHECPRTAENFVTHAKNGYYTGVLFHRVIKGFMIQTGDPLGNGSGGESIWGGEFEDEFNRTLRHDRPFTVSMANSGPGTNGSQFFITTVPTPWLDNKHTIFGRVVKGFDVVSTIENVKTNKHETPIGKDIKIIKIELL